MHVPAGDVPVDVLLPYPYSFGYVCHVFHDFLHFFRDVPAGDVPVDVLLPYPYSFGYVCHVFHDFLHFFRDVPAGDLDLALQLLPAVLHASVSRQRSLCVPQSNDSAWLPAESELLLSH